LRFARKVTLPLPPPIKGGVIKPSPLAGEGRERGILALAKGADLNPAFYSL